MRFPQLPWVIQVLPSLMFLMLIVSITFLKKICFIKRAVLWFLLYKFYASNRLQATRVKPAVPFLYSIWSPLIHLTIVISHLLHAWHYARNRGCEKNRCYKPQWKLEFKEQQALIKLGIPWRSSGQSSALPLQGAQVRSLVREPRSHKVHGLAKQTNKQTIKN